MKGIISSWTTNRFVSNYQLSHVWDGLVDAKLEDSLDDSRRSALNAFLTHRTMDVSKMM